MSIDEAGLRKLAEEGGVLVVPKLEWSEKVHFPGQQCEYVSLEADGVEDWFVINEPQKGTYSLYVGRPEQYLNSENLDELKEVCRQRNIQDWVRKHGFVDATAAVNNLVPLLDRVKELEALVDTALNALKSIDEHMKCNWCGNVAVAEIGRWQGQDPHQRGGCCSECLVQFELNDSSKPRIYSMNVPDVDKVYEARKALEGESNE